MELSLYHRGRLRHSVPSIADRFGLRSRTQLGADLAEMISSGLRGERFQSDLSSIGHLRPGLSLPAYAGLVPDDGLAPIMNLFDRVGGGKDFTQRVTKRTSRDFRGGRLTYDEHDGTDFVCPVGTPLCAAAPGTVVLIRDRWLRGGLTVCVDHGSGVVTQYTHCARALLPIGAKVARGEPVALSGTSGVDLAAFFPWVPPHVHFMSWVRGVPVDPFVATGEDRLAGTWLHRDGPQPSAASTDSTSTLSEVDLGAAQAIADACTDATVRAQAQQVRDEPASLAALLDDAVHHDRFGWPEEVSPSTYRPLAPGAASVRLTLPLPDAEYRGARFADKKRTAP